MSSCKITDLRTPLIKQADITKLDNLRKKGKTLLKASYDKQGLDKFESHQNYSFVAHEKWIGFFGHLANPWSVNHVQMRFSFRINSFDGRMEILSGEDSGKYYGLQSWHYYEGESHVTPPNFDIKKNDKHEFAISAYQYFVELLIRLQSVPIIEFAGTTEVGDVKYDMVLATWGDSSKPTKSHDQYLVYINQESGLMDYCSYSAHDNKLPGASYATATIKYSDYQEINGVLIPMIHEGIISTPQRDRKPIHRLEISSFEFDLVDDTVLFPDKTLPAIGDNKPN